VSEIGLERETRKDDSDTSESCDEAHLTDNKDRDDDDVDGRGPDIVESRHERIEAVAVVGDEIDDLGWCLHKGVVMKI